MLLSRRGLGCLAAALTTSAGWGALTGCSARTAVPPFDYTLLDGTRYTSDTLRGRVVLVNFWATTCAVCVAEMPQLVALHRTLAPRGLQTLAVAVRHDPPASVSRYAESRQLPFGVAIDNTGTIASAFGEVEATPTTFLIDKRGHIDRRIVGRPDFKDLERRIGSLLAEA